MKLELTVNALGSNSLIGTVAKCINEIGKLYDSIVVRVRNIVPGLDLVEEIQSFINYMVGLGFVREKVTVTVSS